MFKNPLLFIYKTVTYNTEKTESMPTYFAFSDECGDYVQHISKRQLQIHPFYIRATLLMNSDEWKKLNTGLRTLKIKYKIPVNSEIKWAYLWKIRNYQKKGLAIPKKEPFKFLEKHTYNQLIDFVSECLELINTLNEKKIILTFTDNSATSYFKVKTILRFHLEEIMQRIEMDLQHDFSNLAVLFIDPVSEQKNKYFREIYSELYESGGLINNFTHIKDSLNIEQSHHSVGIQIADFIAGAFSAVLKSKGKGNYSKGIDMFKKSILPNIRENGGKIYGFGIREVPKNHKIRTDLKTKIDGI